MKTCKSCNKRLKLDKFYVIKDKHDYYCKICRNLNTKKSHQRIKQKSRCSVNKCPWQHYAGGMCKKHYERKRKGSKPRNNFHTYINNPVKVKYNYGITLAKLLKLAKAGCNVCGIDENLSIDHDHKCCNRSYKICGKCVRGVLCSSCNRTLGILEREGLRTTHPQYEKFMKYIEKYESKK